MKKMLELRFAWVVGLIGFIQPAAGQSDANTPANGDREITSSIATYTTDLRSAVLDVAQYPHVLVKLERIQARSSQSFQDLISGYPREEQAKFYELSRFPDRLSLLVGDGRRKSAEDLNQLLGDLPKDTRASVMDVYNNHFNDLAKIHSIYQSSEEALQKTISDYPQPVQQDFRKVVSRPEVMNLLTENIDLTTNLGEDYRANPNAVIEELDSLHNQQLKDFADYKKEAENNPEMQQEMRNAADRFSSSYVQNDSPVDAYLDNQPANYSNSAPVINNYYNYNPYPYWFSYPYWYATPIWYPVPYYYNTGFYYGPGGRIVVWGFPSYAYSNWFFSFGYRHYPHLYSHYHSYCYAYYPSAHRGGRYGGYYSNRNDYGSRRNHYNRGYQDGSTGNRTRASGNRYLTGTGINNGRTSLGQNQTVVNTGRNRMNTNRMSIDNSRTFRNMNRTTINEDRVWTNSNRSTPVNRNSSLFNSNENRTSLPIQHNYVSPSNSNSRSIPQFHSSPSNNAGRQFSGGGSRGGFSGARGGSGGGGGGGRRGR